MTNRFHNITDPMLADEIGKLDAETKAARERLDVAKAEFKQRGTEKAEGERFTVTRSETVRWSLNVKAVRAEMGDDWTDQHSRPAHVTSLRITANRAALAAAA